ncbi:acetate uptake transporter, partial [Methanococcoides sp. SA1]|nr:acetate uptake transporter [Methanococcoides sp. SA1]
FTSYGAFWLTLVFILIAPKLGLGDAPTAIEMSAYLFMWGLFTFGMFIGTFKANRALQVVFGSLTLLFLLLAISDLTGNAAMKQFAGYEGIFCGLSAIYLALAEIINEKFGRTILPIGE